MQCVRLVADRLLPGCVNAFEAILDHGKFNSTAAAEVTMLFFTFEKSIPEGPRAFEDKRVMST